ncbi:threonine synthase [bacterium]|nr:threonine synthase [bacterium]
MSNSCVISLRCADKKCGKEYEKKDSYVCEYCFAPLEVNYDYKKIKNDLTIEKILSREKTLWRYKELLPLDSEPTVGLNSGFTPLIKADNLAKILGVDELYIKNDGVSFPTLSFKDRVVSVALSKAKELGFDTVGCASTGNLANSVAAQATAANLKSFIFIPSDLEESKIIGTSIYGSEVIAVNGAYDDVNRLCTEVLGSKKWGFVNINLRTYYSEGSKTVGYEIIEQLGWKAPKNIVVCMASGSLLTKIYKSVKEFEDLGFIEPNDTKIFGAQASGCSPISTAVKNNWDTFKPVKPNTIAKSLAIGNPADGVNAINLLSSINSYSEDVSDEEIVSAMKLLAETEGIFTETAGGVTLASAKKLIEAGRMPRNESIVLVITGNGLKTQDPLVNNISKPYIIEPKIEDFNKIFD